MSKFDECTKKFRDLPFMDEARALYMRDFINKNKIQNVLELGFLHGKSSAYFASILEDQGASGHLTTIDLERAKKYEPNIFQVLETLDIRHRVTPLFAHRSHTWEMAKLIQSDSRPEFDFCYFDGGHTWDVTGFGFILVDMLLKSGGWIAFDDLNWSILKSPSVEGKSYSEDEREACGVRMVFELIVPHLKYVNIFEEEKFGWGFAQKP